MAKKIIPLKDYRILNRQEGIWIVMWAIRNYEPVSYRKLFRLITGIDFDFASKLNTMNRDFHPENSEEIDLLEVFSRTSNKLENALSKVTDEDLTGSDTDDLSEHLHWLRVRGDSMIDALVTDNEKEYAGGSIANVIVYLADRGLVDINYGSNKPENQRDESNLANSTLRLSKTFRAVIDTYRISLRQYAAASGETITANPVFGSPILRNRDEWAQVFVLMPFHQDINPIYEKCILPVTKALDLTCKRGDDFFSSRSIMDEVWSSIFRAEVCIAECSGRNANVFYELGIAHTLGIPVITIARSIEDIPFDIAHRRAFIYENTPDGLNTLKRDLVKSLVQELELEPQIKETAVLSSIGVVRNTTLSERALNILHFIKDYLEVHGYPPTIREIGERVGISSTSVVNYNLNKLVQAGYLSRDVSAVRGLKLLKDPP